jgi:two-component system response regulator AtoC
MLIEHFLRCYSQQFGRALRPLSSRTMTALQDYPWPGNIRELENLVKSYVILGSEDAIHLELLQTRYGSSGEGNGNGTGIDTGNGNSNGFGIENQPTSLKAAVKDLENRLILCTLEQQQWNRRRAAKALKISYRSLLYRLKQSDGALKQRLQASVHANND